MKNEPQEMNLAMLAMRAKTPARTIRLYISMGLLPGPLRAGRNAAYGREHLERLEQIRILQRKGMTLTQVRESLAGGKDDSALPPSASWRVFMPAPDVQIMMREDVSPWRARALRLAMEEFTRLVNAPEQTKEQQDE